MTRLDRLGVTVSLEIERKFVLATSPSWSHPVLNGAKLINLEQAYLLVDDGEQKRIRRSSSGGETVYHYAHLVALRPGARTVSERQIDKAEYEELMHTRDPSRHIVKKDRRCFTWRDQFFELDHIHQPASRTCHLLEIEVEDEDQVVTLPTFLHIEREVTGEAAYSNATIALG